MPEIADYLNSLPSFTNEVISSFVNSVNPTQFASLLRSRGISPGAENNSSYSPQEARFSSSPQDKDWRVKISHPTIYDSSPVLQPLANTGGIVFPYLPTINIAHSAAYQPIDTTHTNYPFYAYKSSQIDEIQITGKFTVADATEARYWIAVMHFLRTVTKMYFGQGPNLGNPPPICKLDGYGDFVYNSVSVVVKSFSINLPNDVDYITTQLSTTSGGQSSSNINYVPSVSEITVTLLPVFSRDKIKSFNLDAFSKGQLIVGSDGRSFI